MSEDSFDSFESGSDSEGEAHTGGASSAASGSERVPAADPSRRVRELSSSHGKAYWSFSDQDEQENSASLTSNWLKMERSPKPKRRFKDNFKKPNISNIKQRIKNKLWKDVAVFGVSVETAIQRSQLGTDGIELPTVFRECIDYLEERGMGHEGIYRLPGVKSRIEDLRTRYDKGEIVDLSESDPNMVASLLKLYLRDLPEPLIPSRLIPRFNSITASPQEEQLAAIEELMKEVPGPSQLLLSWLLVHMDHIIDHSSVNKMTLPNLVIVFSPTLQIPPPVFHLLYRHSHTLLSDIELKKYERPAVVSTSRKDSAVVDLSHVNQLETEEEITAELQKLTGILEKLHGKVAGKFDERDEYCWELQRAVTELRRKLKSVKRSSQQNSGDDDEFLKTLMLMEATLTAENEELIAKKEVLQTSIREEAETVEQLKKELKKYPPRSSTEPVGSEEESEEEAELAKKVAGLRWHGKELEMLSFQHGSYISESVDGLEAVLINVHVHRHFRSMNQCCAEKQEPDSKYSRRRAANTANQGKTKSTTPQAETEYGRVAS